MYVIEKQMLEFEQDLSVSGLCPDVHFTIISVGHMTSLNLELVNCWDANLIPLLYRCCGESSDQWQRSKSCSPSNCNTTGRTLETEKLQCNGATRAVHCFYKVTFFPVPVPLAAW